MRSFENLPENYTEICSVDLQNNKKTYLIVNGLNILITVLLAIPMHFVVPITTLFDIEAGTNEFLIKFGVYIVLVIVYIFLHELVHGIAMKICGTKKVKFGLTRTYAYAGSNDYYDKKSYIFIALAPVVLWGIVLVIVNLFVPVEWFWVVYFIQIFNFSGASGDLFVTVKFSRLPSDILIQDSGVCMTVFSKKQ